MDTYIFMHQRQSYALELILEQNKKKTNQHQQCFDLGTLMV